MNKQLVRKDPILNLSYERMGDSGITFICESKDLSHVSQLNLSWNEISDTGLKKIATCKSLTNLTHLILNSNEIDVSSYQINPIGNYISDDNCGYEFEEVKKEDKKK